MKRIATTRVMLLAGMAVMLCGTAFAQRGGGGRGMGMGGSHSDRDAAHDSMEPRTPVAPQLGLPGRWWDERKNVKSLNLRADQKQRMDDIFKAGKPTLATALSNLQREEFNLSTMSGKDRQDETKVFAAISRVEAARVELAREATHVQMQIRQQLDPEQLTRLDAEIASQR